MVETIPIKVIPVHSVYLEEYPIHLKYVIPIIIVIRIKVLTNLLHFKDR